MDIEHALLLLVLGTGVTVVLMYVVIRYMDENKEEEKKDDSPWKY
jgi:heme/copper-type cytochrome/quinol oxidase subunit 2